MTSVGVISRGRYRGQEQAVIACNDLCEQLQLVQADDKVKAVVLRVNSQGRQRHRCMIGTLVEPSICSLSIWLSSLCSAMARFGLIKALKRIALAGNVQFGNRSDFPCTGTCCSAYMHIFQATHSSHCSVCRCCRRSLFAHWNNLDLLMMTILRCYTFVAVILPCVCFVSVGGCSVASDAICHEVMRLRQAGKPVVVSMGNYAASGGYKISGQSCPSQWEAPGFAPSL